MFWGSSNKKKESSGFPGDCSEEQLQTLEVFRGFTRENLPANKYDDPYLLRFLRARKFYMKDVKKMWTDFIDWRVKNNVDNALHFHLPEIINLRKYYPHGFHHTDKQGRPIYIERVGLLNIEEIFKFTTPDRLLQYYILSYETMIDLIFTSATRAKRDATKQDDILVEQSFTILDLNDVKLSQAGKAYQFIKPVTKMAQDNYPELLGNMFIINAPFLFTGIWAMVKGWLDEKTKDKIKIIGSSYKKELLTFVEPEHLPRYLECGKCTCPVDNCLNLNIGPWNPEGKEIYEINLSAQKPQQPLVVSQAPLTEETQKTQDSAPCETSPPIVSEEIPKVQATPTEQPPQSDDSSAAKV